ncbi:hypothetical protein, partial [Vibrio lentus]|uniref:hypothetical protein n=4 Tax=Vibrio lentus TaxID=136468 RepID=UPI001A7E099A
GGIHVIRQISGVMIIRMEIIKLYPLMFLLTVIVPVLGGAVGGLVGWESLKSKLQDEQHKQQLQESLGSINEKIDPITSQIATLQRYESELTNYNQKDEVLSAVLAQYRKMKSAAETFYQFRGTDSRVEQGQLAEHILGTITDNAAPFVEAKNLPNKPLIIGIGHNTFKVIFSVPMRIAPELEFTGLPKGVIPEVSDKSKFGFVVQFSPENITINQFGFGASAEL